MKPMTFGIYIDQTFSMPIINSAYIQRMYIYFKSLKSTHIYV